MSTLLKKKLDFFSAPEEPEPQSDLPNESYWEGTPKYVPEEDWWLFEERKSEDSNKVRKHGGTLRTKEEL